MGKIVFVSSGGNRIQVDGIPGESVMRAASDHGIPGIAAECGDFLSCATCHVYVSRDWVSRIPPPSNDEQTMVECAVEVRDTSRLSCQIIFNGDLDGLEIEIPEAQA